MQASRWSNAVGRSQHRSEPAVRIQAPAATAFRQQSSVPSSSEAPLFVAGNQRHGHGSCLSRSNGDCSSELLVPHHKLGVLLRASGGNAFPGKNFVLTRRDVKESEEVPGSE